MNGLKCTAEVSVHYKILFIKGDTFCLQEAANIPVVNTDLERHLQ